MILLSLYNNIFFETEIFKYDAKRLIKTSKWLARYFILIYKKILKRVPACVSFALQLGVTFQQSLVLGNTSHYPVNPSLMIGDYVTPGNGISPQTYRQ